MQSHLHVGEEIKDEILRRVKSTASQGDMSHPAAVKALVSGSVAVAKCGIVGLDTIRLDRLWEPQSEPREDGGPEPERVHLDFTK